MFDVPEGRCIYSSRSLLCFVGMWWFRVGKGVVGFGNCTGWVFYLLDCTFGLFLDKKQAFDV